MLKEIISDKRREIRKQKKQYPMELIREKIEYFPLPRDFKGALQGATKQVKVVAEIKKASPSHGEFNSALLKENTVAGIAEIYERAGASAVSVLTNKKYFSGSPEDLREVKRVTSVPVLRKDFIIDEYQVYESRVMGADAVLLIAAILPAAALSRLINLVYQLKMQVLVEVGSERDIEKAVGAGAEIIGINNRNLETMQVDINRTIVLAKALPPDIITVSESGIETGAQVRMLREKAGINAILVGRSLVTSEDPGIKIRELVKGE